MTSPPSVPFTFMFGGNGAEGWHKAAAWSHKSRRQRVHGRPLEMGNKMAKNVLEEAPVQGDKSNLVFLFVWFFYLVSTARKLTARGFLQLVCNHVMVALTASPGWKHTTSSSTLTGTETYQLVCPDDMRFMRIWCNSGLQRRPPRPREAPLTRTLFSSTGPAAALHSVGPLSLPSNSCPARHITHQRWEQSSGRRKKRTLCICLFRRSDTFRGQTFSLIWYGPERRRSNSCHPAAATKRNTSR